MNELNWISAMFAQRKFSLAEWLSTIRGKKHWTIWARDDVKPFIASYCNMAAEMIKQRNTILKRLKESNV